MMDYSLFFFAADEADGDCYALLLDSTRYADEAGFSAIWIPERHFDPFGGRYPNPAVVGAALATITERVKIRAGSVTAPLHDPIRIAEEWSVVDNLSHGRVGVSFASGWHAADFVLRPHAYQDRRQNMLESVEMVRRLWRGESMLLPDGVGTPRSVQVHPAPVQPELPIWLTSSGSPATFEAAGRLGTGVLTYLLGTDDETLASNIAAYRAALAANHGPVAKGHVTVMVHTLLGDDRERVLGVARAPFRQYLRGQFDLVLRTPGFLPEGLQLDELPERHRERLIAAAANRYLHSCTLIGSIDDGVAFVNRMAAIGVDELACLVDFGVPASEMLASLGSLKELQRRTTEVDRPPGLADTRAQTRESVTQ